MTESARLALLFSAPLVAFDSDGNPHSIDLLKLETERELLFDSLTEADKELEVRVEAATTDNFRTLVTLGCRALHYSGHGHPDFLAFEDGRGAIHSIDAKMLKSLFEAGDTRGVGFVFVSACHSRKAGEAFVDAGVKHVVAVRLETTVYDNAARNFARAFYLALVAGKTVKQAFEIGKQAVAGMPNLPEAAREKEKFLLLPEYGNHDEAIFSNLAGGDWRNVTPEPPPNNLPSPPERFIGRNAEMQKTIASALDNRLTTVYGAPGIGKTALAVSSANYINDRRLFRGGAFFIDLRNKLSVEAVRSAISQELGIEAQDDKKLFSALGSRRCLIVLDNFEDPLHNDPQGIRKFLTQLLQQARNIKALVTSRQSIAGGVLGIAEKTLPLKRLDPLSAARLFMELSPRLLTDGEFGGFDLDEALENLSKHPVLQVLSGHPNAISLVAPLLQDKSLDQLNELLREQKEEALFVQDVPADQRDATTSFVVSLNVSLNYLRERNPDAKVVRLFALMGLLPGGALDEDLDEIWGDDWHTLMDKLVQASLVERVEVGGKEHFSTLPLVTSFAERLLTKEDREEFSVKIAERFAKISALLRNNIVTKNASSAHMLLKLVEDNIWACLNANRPAREKRESEAASPTALIATYLPEILLLADRAHDGLRAARLGFEACRVVKDRLGEANTLQALGALKVRVDDLEGARRDYETALPIYRDIQARIGEANTLQALGALKVRVDDLEGARRDYETALPIYRDIQDRLGEANTLQALGALKVRVDDLEGARRDYETALPIYRDIQDRLGEANTLQALGALKVRVDDLEGARRDYETALPIYRDIQDRLGEANTLQALGALKVRVDDLEGARRDYETALPIYRDIQDRLGEANTLQALGDLKVRVDDLEGARRDYETALPIYRDIQSRIGEANTLKALGDLKVRVDDLEGARRDYETALPIYRDIQDRLGEANTLQALGALKVRVDDLEGARRDYETALPIYRDIQDRLGEANTLQALGALKVRVDDLEGARRDYETALPIYRDIQARLGEANTLKALGDLKVRVADLEGARRDYETALPIYRDIQDRLGEANCHQSLGLLFAAEGKPEIALEELRIALDIHIEIRAILSLGGDLAYMGRTLNGMARFSQAALLFEKALSIHRAINDRYGEALDLQSQAQAFINAEEGLGALAALWLAREIFRSINSPAADRIDKQFEAMQSEFDDETQQSMTSDLKEHAEERRKEALASLEKEAEEDPFVDGINKAVQKIFNSLKVPQTN